MFLLAACAAVISLQSLQAAAPGGEREKAVESLKREFSGAMHICWSKLPSGVFQANFVVDDERLNAFFDAEGQMLAVSRFIKAENLPMQVSRMLKTRFAGYSIDEVVELVKDGFTSYVITVENQSRKITIEASDDGKASIFKKIKKN